MDSILLRTFLIVPILYGLSRPALIVQADDFDIKIFLWNSRKAMSGTFHSPGQSSLWLSTTCRDDIAHTKSGSGETDNEEEHGTLLELCVAFSRDVGFF